MNEKLKKEENCVLCKAPAEIKYSPMEEWKIEGILCSKCYSKKIFEFYPGKHIRVNLSDD